MWNITVQTEWGEEFHQGKVLYKPLLLVSTLSSIWNQTVMPWTPQIKVWRKEKLEPEFAFTGETVSIWISTIGFVGFCCCPWEIVCVCVCFYYHLWKHWCKIFGYFFGGGGWWYISFALNKVQKITKFQWLFEGICEVTMVINTVISSSTNGPPLQFPEQARTVSYTEWGLDGDSDMFHI